MVTCATSPAHADLMPSSAAMAPEGSSSRQPVCRARSMTSGWSSNAPTLITRRSLPASNTRRANSCTTAPPAASTTMSERATRSSREQKGTAVSRVSRNSLHELSVRLVTHAPAATAPESTAFSRPLPMAPHPTMPMVFIRWLPDGRRPAQTDCLPYTSRGGAVSTRSLRAMNDRTHVTKMLQTPRRVWYGFRYLIDMVPRDAGQRRQEHHRNEK